MDRLIPVINQLQDIFMTVGTNPIELNLPQIVVVGSQSSGKSSVLESIVGKDFLPRGKGICTRRPLILQLIHNKHSHEEYGSFHHCPDLKFIDFLNIKNEIIKETERITTSNTEICSTPINLKIYSKKLINLTIIDLPGITKLAIGDQPSDIEAKTRDLVKSYASNPHSIILAVIPANADIATSDALQIAKELDPLSQRTVGVLTKIDLMDKGNSSVDILNNTVFPLKYGYVGVKNRSQLEIDRNVMIPTALKNEEKFFAEDSSFKTVADKTGTVYLTKLLNKILIKHIKNSLPKLKFHVKTMLSEIKKEMEAYGIDANEDKASQSAKVLSILSRYSSCFNDAIDGKEKNISEIKELYGGACISRIFHDTFSTQLKKIDPFSELTEDKIKIAIQNATGTRPSLFVPEISFETLSKSQMRRLKQPSINCVDLVFSELIKVSRNCCKTELKKYSKLGEKIIDCVSDVLTDNREPTMRMVDCIVDMEMAYINTRHPDFIGGADSVQKALNLAGIGRNHRSNEIEEQIEMSRLRLKKTLNERSKIEVEIIKTLIDSYFKIVQRNVMDSVPKAIMLFLVNRSKNDLQSKLVSMLYKEDLFDELLEENPEVYNERRKCKELSNVLNRALTIIESLKGFNV